LLEKYSGKRKKVFYQNGKEEEGRKEEKGRR
jgi:hypothetical protein